LFKILESKKSCEFEISLITIDSEHLGIPDTKYSSLITMSSSEFSRICRELYAINETVNIEADKNYIKFYVNNENIGGGFTLESNDSDSSDLQCKIETETVVNLAFALRYLNMFTKASSIGQQVNLFLSKEYPLMVKNKLAELGLLKFYLAPRISDNDDNK
jgi:proliferating cell nuclear antigen